MPSQSASYHNNLFTIFIVFKLMTDCGHVVDIFLRISTIEVLPIKFDL